MSIEQTHTALEQLLTGPSGLVDVDEYDKLELKLLSIDHDSATNSVTLEHCLMDTLYIRTMHAKAGTIIVGATCKVDSTVHVTKDALVVWYPEQESSVAAEGDYIVSPAGTRRIGYVLEDCTWVNVYAKQGQTVEENEDNLFVDSKLLINRRNK